MKKTLVCFSLVLAMLICAFPLKISAAPADPYDPYITSPMQRWCENSFGPVVVRWNAPASGTVSKYIISVRHLSNNKIVNELILDKVSVSASARSYTIPWSKLERSSAYRLSVGAVLTNGRTSYSQEIYFFTTTYKVVANKTLSFHIYEGFPLDWKNAVYYSAQAWDNVLGLHYEVLNTYPFSQCHNNNTVVSGDGENRITAAPPPAKEGKYLMATKIVRDSSGRAKEADINVNTRDYKFTLGAKSGYYDFQSAMTHEMGHAAGMPHCFEDFASAWTMYYIIYDNDNSKGTLEDGDKNMFSCIHLNV